MMRRAVFTLRSHRLPVAALACCVLLAACGGGGGGGDEGGGASTSDRGTDSTTAAPTRPGEAIEWSTCGDIQCATLEVPVDHADPTGPTLDLALGRRRAKGDRIGTLLVNPGGPGAAGIPVVQDAESYFSNALLDRFDIVAWDPRGSGDSTAIDCGDKLDYFFDTDKSPDDAAEVAANVAAARRLATACEERSAALLPHLSSRATVDDMDTIRAALGEEKLTYLGFSYGTYLGALYADRYPTRVRALVLDGALDPSLGFEDVTRDQAVGFDSALNAYLDNCARTKCGFGGSDPHRAYDRLIAQIDAEPLPGEVGGEHRTLGAGEADLGVASALYAGTQGWSILTDALKRAARGDGTTLLQLSDAYTGREPGGTYDNSQAAFFGIGCLDAPAPTIDQLPLVAQRIEQAAPEFGASTTWLSSPCSVWPVPAEGQPAPVHGTGAPPIVVLGTSNDPATPLKWAQALATQLESGNLVVYRGEGHTAYARGNQCIDDAVDDYLITLKVPPAGLVC
jgi:pimeloyl-ACP methyl ester carboxylesterase